MQDGYRYAGRLADFASGEISSCEIPGIAICNAEGHLAAVTDFCTHEGVSFTGGYGALFEKKIFCMLHSSIFDIESGESVSGPAYDPLSVFDVRLDGQDVYVSGEARRREG
jgi:3-phenylpropionate/trans-cinnamate dioxygenase ferredoxin subunit